MTTYIRTGHGESWFLFADRCSLPTDVGMPLDPVPGSYYARTRNYSPSLGRVLRQERKSRLSAGSAYREINQDPAGYPGAAAQARPLASAGFRGIEETYSTDERRSPPLNINGANTYQFVESNPVGNVDSWGLYSLTVGGVTFTDNGNIAAATVNYHPAAPLEGTPVAPPPSPWQLAPAMLPHAITPHTAAEGLADTAQGVQNGLMSLINSSWHMSPIYMMYSALQQEIKAMRGWPRGLPNPQWDPYNDPTKPWSEGLRKFAGPTLILGPMGELGAADDGLITVSRWGRPGLQPGDWVMKGPSNFSNYTFSSKWQPRFGNQFAPFSTGQEFTVLSTSVQWPTGWESWKVIFGQRIYIGPGE